MAPSKCSINGSAAAATTATIQCDSEGQAL